MRKILFLALFLFLAAVPPAPAQVESPAATAAGPAAEPSAGPAAQPAVPFEEAHRDKAYIVLLSSEEIVVKPDWSFTRKIHRRIKLQKDEAKNLGEVPISYDKKLDRITEQKGLTVTPDGAEHEVVKTQDISRYYGEPMYSDAMVRILSMPAVGIGSVLDVSYTLESQGLSMKNAFWDTQFMRPRHPVKEFRYSLTFPKELGIRYREFGLTQKPEVEEKDGMVTYRWVLHDLYDDRQEERYLPPPAPNDDWEACEFSSIQSWEDLARWYYELSEKNVRMTPEMEAEAVRVAGGLASARDKTRAVLEYVQDNFRYVSMSFGENAFEPHPTDEVFRNKYGDCKDLSLLTRAMLRAVGVTAHLALFNVEMAITDPSGDLPIPNLFNHVMLRVEDPPNGDFYADPLLKGYDIGEYPPNCQRAYTFVIDGKNGYFGRLPEFSAESAAVRNRVEVDIHDDWSGTFDETRTLGLDDSIALRLRWKSMSEKERKEYIEEVEFSLAKGGEVMDNKLEGLEEPYGHVRMRIKYRCPEEFPSADGLIVISLNYMERDEASEKKQRREPFFFPVNKLLETEIVYRMPAGFEVFYLPPDIDVDGPNLRFTRKFTRTDKGVTVTETIVTKRALLPKEALADLRKFGEDLSRQTRQRLVFRKAPPAGQE